MPQYIIAEGSVAVGFKLWGPFSSIESAVKSIEIRQPLMYGGTVLEILPMEKHPVKPFNYDSPSPVLPV